MTGLKDGLGGDDDHAENGLPFQLGKSGYSTFETIANGLLTRKQMPVLRPFDSVNEVGEGVAGTQMDMLNDEIELGARLAMFQCPRTMHSLTMLYFSASRLLPTFLDQIKAAKAPYFGFINLVDPHEPYVPDPRTYKPETTLPPNFTGDVLNRRLGPELADPDAIADATRRFYVKDKIRIAGSAKTVATDLSPQALQIYRNRYEASVRDLDSRLREMFAALERDHLLENTIVVVTSDHGESFGEKDFITHNLRDRGDFETTHHVPLLILLPPRYRVTTRRIEQKVSIADLAPTIYDLAGLDWTPLKSAFPDGYGRSLAPMFMTVPPRVAQATPPVREKSDHSADERERRAAMQSLGYVSQ
jgi:arylsulfatase A-like enzyme